MAGAIDWNVRASSPTLDAMSREHKPASSLEDLKFTRDLYLSALSRRAVCSFEQVMVLRQLSEEIRALDRNEFDALDRLLFAWRQKEVDREAVLKMVRAAPLPK
jgi:hypothetical protein